MINKMYVLTAVTFILLIFISPGFAQGPGSSAGTGFSMALMIPARAYAMAGAVCAFDGDLGLMMHNPAGVSSITGRGLEFDYSLGFGDVSFANITYAQRLIGGVIAGSLFYFDEGQITLTYEDGTDHAFSAQKDFACAFSYSKEILKDLPIGFSLKALSSTILEKFSGSAYAADAGIIYRTPVKPLKIGLSVLNIGTKIKYFETEENLPLSIRLGLAYTLGIHDKGALSTNIEASRMVNEEMTVLSFGEEYRYNEIIAVRAGYSAGPVFGLTAGLGLNIKNYVIDYAMGFSPELSSFGEHKFSIKIRI